MGLCCTFRNCRTRFPSSSKMQDRAEGTAQTMSVSEGSGRIKCQVVVELHQQDAKFVFEAEHCSGTTSVRQEGRLSEHQPLQHPQAESGRAVLHSQPLIRLREAQFPR